MDNEKIKKRKIQADKTFKSYWLDDPLFKPWLLPDTQSKYMARCKICNVTIKSGKSELQKHAGTKKHLEKLKLINHNKNVDILFKINEDTVHKDNVKKAEIKLAAVFAANNIAFRVIDQLEPVLKEIFPDSKICQDINIKRTKCTEIVKNVLCKKETNDLVTHLRNNTFSVLLDESTDIGDYKSVAVLARFLNHDNKIETRLLELIQLDARDLGATALYNTFKACLERHKIPLQNIIGVASDGASVMIGKNHSFFQLLQNDVPHVILLRCICHSASLVASNACTVLPRSSEELLRGIYTYVSGSSKRSAQLQEMQEYFQERKHKILKLSATRWLSHFECVVRILENWNVLEHYFAIAVLEDKLKSAELILSELKNIYTKGYLFFLIYVLNLFNSFNALFQGRKPLIHVLYSECTNLMKQLCKNYLDGAIVLEQNLLTLNLNNPRHFSPLEKLYVGPECSALVKTMPPDGRDLFLKNCLKFYVTAAVDLQRRLPEEIFRDMRFLNPNVAFAKSDDERNIDFNILCDKLKHINADKTEIAIEWRNLPISFSETEIKKFTSLQLHEMWLNICSTKKFSEDLAFPNLGKLVKSILILPHSNAETERIFSIVTDTKTKKRNRIGESSLNAVAVFRSFLQATELDVVKYPITQDHLQLHNVAMYSFKHS